MTSLVRPALVLALIAAFLAPPSVASGAPVPDAAFLEQHCFDCHDAETKKGDLDLTALKFDLADKAAFARWVKVHDKVRDGEMPPKKKAQPEAKERATFLAALAAPLAATDAARQAQRGRSIVRRLNRTEFQNSLAALFQMPVDILESLPPDATSGGFDTVGAALNVSAVQMESYLQAIDVTLDGATKLIEPPPAKTWRLSYLQTHGMMEEYRKGGPHTPEPDGIAMFAPEYFSHMNSLLDTWVVPHSARYRVKVAARALRSPEPITLTVRMGGPGHKESDEVPRKVLGNVSVHEAPVGQGQVFEFDAFLERGQMFRIYPSSLRKMRFEGPQWQMKQQEYRGPGVVVQWVEVEGPLYESWPPASHDRLWAGVKSEPIPGVVPNEDVNAHLDGPPTDPARPRLTQLPRSRANRETGNRNVYDPKQGVGGEMLYRRTRVNEPLRNTRRLVSANPKADAARLLRGFVAAAYRRPVTDADAQPFIALAQRWLDDGQSFESALRGAYQAVLTSPDFLYFQNPGPQLDDHALAERLAFFLTRQPADAELRAVAASGKLRDAAALRAQTERLLGSADFERFVRDFADQWLDLKLINFTAPDSDLYPEFEDVLQWSMVEETRAFLRELIAQNLPVRNIADARFAMLNDRLAKLYGVPGVRGAEIRRVELPPDSPRGGVLTQGSVLKVTANGTTTSPVIRGKWVLERILGVHPDPPPPGVPAIEPDIRGATTVMEQLRQHRSDESCASCHAKIDPPGVALECFDVMGAFRDRYRALDPAKAEVKVRHSPEAPPEQKWKLALPVVAGDVLATGERFADVREFKRLLAAQPDRLAAGVVEKLILFSTGASLSFADRAEVDRIVAATRADEHGFRSLLHAVVQSPLFLQR